MFMGKTYQEFPPALINDAIVVVRGRVQPARRRHEPARRQHLHARHRAEPRIRTAGDLGSREPGDDRRRDGTRAADLDLVTLIAFSAFAFLVAAGTLVLLVVSVVRPLTTLQQSARAIASGNWATRARVSGPSEVASLAHDFNDMTETLLDRTTKLKESEQRFRQVLDVSRDFIYKLNLQTRTYEYVSPSVLPMSGFTPEEFAAMGFVGVYERFHPEDQERLRPLVDAFLDNTLADDKVINLEYRWKRKDGEYYWLNDSGALIRDAEGSPTAIVGVARDVTARKEAEAALQHLERQRAMRNRIAEVFLTVPDDEVYAEMLRVVIESAESQHGFFAYVNENGDLVCPSMVGGISDPLGMPHKTWCSHANRGQGFGVERWWRRKPSTLPTHSLHLAATSR